MTSSSTSPLNGRASGKKARPVRHRIEYGVFRLIHGLARWTRHATVRRLGAGLGNLAYRVGKKPRQLALDNMALALPESTAAERHRWTRQCFAHYGSHFAEVISAARWRRQDIEAYFDIDGEEHLAAAQAEHGGYFLTTGHYGSQELALYPMALNIESLYAVARPPNNPFVDAEMRRIRGRFGARIIDKQGAAHRMLNAQRRGGHVAVIIDQHVRPSAGEQIPFFGRPAWTSITLAMLSARAKVPVIHFTCVPQGAERYRLSYRPGILPDGKGRDAWIELTRRYMAEVEQDIRQAPQYWLWMHRRWRD